MLSKFETKNTAGMNKTFRHRTMTSKGKSRNMVWMLRDNSLDNLKYLRWSREDWVKRLKNMPEHKEELMNYYKLYVIRIWI